MNNVITMPSQQETYRSAAAKKKAHGEEIIAESGIINRAYGCSAWTTSLISKYLRPYSLGPGTVAYGRARNRYRRADVEAAWLTVPPAIRREREALMQGYYSTSSVEEYLAHKAKQRTVHDA